MRSLYSKATALLYSCGIPAHISGFQFLRDAVMIVSSISGKYCITKDVYPEIAMRYASTPARIERSIRHAIEIAWSRGCCSNLENLTDSAGTKSEGRPTNSEFITLIYELAAKPEGD